MRPVAVVGTGITRFGRFPETGLKALSSGVVVAAMADAGARAADVDSVFFANAVAGVITGQEMIRGQVALRETALAGIPIFNVENACASGSSAFHLAWLAVASGRSDCALVVGAERLTHHDKRVSLDALARGVDLDEPRPPSSGGGSIFMDLYAEKARAWMHETGVTREDLAQVVVKSRMAAAVNPDAQFREPTTVEAVLGSRTVADPLTVPMCSGIGPTELHVVEMHDASAPAELMHYENLGLCRRGEAGARQRPRARVGLAENNGGQIGLDAAVAVATLLAA